MHVDGLDADVERFRDRGIAAEKLRGNLGRTEVGFGSLTEVD